MRRILLVLTALLALIGSVVRSDQTSSPTSTRHWVLRVTSLDPAREVRFEGSYLSRGDGSPYRALEGKTPFEVAFESELVAGMFRAKASDEQIRVELFDLGGARGHMASAGTGRALLVEGDSSQESGSIRPF